MNILQINASARSNGAQSTRLAEAITARLIGQHPGAVVEVRDLATQQHSVLDEATLGALFTQADQRIDKQSVRVAKDVALIAQVQADDVVVFGVPMCKFGIPVQLRI